MLQVICHCFFIILFPSFFIVCPIAVIPSSSFLFPIKKYNITKRTLIVSIAITTSPSLVAWIHKFKSSFSFIASGLKSSATASIKFLLYCSPPRIISSIKISSHAPYSPPEIHFIKTSSITVCFLYYILIFIMKRLLS